MDEIHLLKKPRAVFTNIKERTIIAVLEKRTKKVVLAHLKAMPDKERVEVVTMDMWNPYYDAVCEAMPAQSTTRFTLFACGAHGVQWLLSRLSLTPSGIDWGTAMTIPDVRVLLTPRQLIGAIRALRRHDRIAVTIETSCGQRTCAVRVSKAEALRQVRRLYRCGRKVGATMMFGELTIG